MPSITRMTIAFDEATPKRLKEVAEKFDISFARLIGCLLAQPDEEIAKAIDAHYSKLFPSSSLKKAQEREILNMLKGMSKEQIAELVAAKEVAK